MMRHFLCLMGLSLLSLSATPAFAQTSQGSGFYFEETFIPVLKNEDSIRDVSVGGDNATPAESTFGYDSRTTVGYVFGRGLLIGATYNIFQTTTKRDATSARESMDKTNKSNEFGPTLGWVGGNWRVLLSYLMSGKKSEDEKNVDSTGAVSGDTSFTNTDMTGYQFLFGYSFMIGKNFGIGPSLVYRSVNYGKQSKVNRASTTPGAEDYEDLTLNDKVTRTTLDAMISVTFRF